MFNAMQTQNALGAMVHPMVREMYMKKTSENKRTQDILVIEPEFENSQKDTQHTHDHNDFNSFWVELGELQKQAKRECGNIDYIDVRI